MAVEYLAAALGVPLVPALAGGTNFAVAGAATGVVPYPSLGGPLAADNVGLLLGFPLPPTGILNAQVPLFASTLTSPIDPDALFFVWGGPNDLAINPASGALAAANIGATIDALYALGARRFFVPNMPDLGLTPSAGAGGAAATLATIDFNMRLGVQLAARSALSGIRLTAFDTFGALQAIVANPAVYGFTNVDDECYTGPYLGFAGIGTACATPDQYLIWDGSHPTTRGHQLLGAAFAEAVPQGSVPEPTTLALTAAALVGLAVRRRRAA